MQPEYVETVVEKLVPGGEGLARIDGQVCFIPGVLPGEYVKAPVVQQKKGWMRCGQPEILEAAAEREKPFCSLFGICGGCSWQHIPYRRQLETKVNFCKEALIRQGGLTENSANSNILQNIKAQASPSTAYRVRIRPLITEDKKTAQKQAAFRAAGSSKPVTVTNCPLVSGGINKFLANVQEASEKNGNPELPAGSEPMVFGNDEHYWVQGIDSLASAKVKDKVFQFPPGVFFQSNLKLLPAMLDSALSGVKSGKTALDLYGGVGLFGAFLADHYEKVIGVERNAKSRKYWENHVGKKGRFYAQSLENWIVRNKKVSPDCIVVDPPRGGLGKTVLQGLTELSSPKLVYVSCNPVTQARDLKYLTSHNYRIKKYTMFDMYPHTPHMETICILKHA